MREGKGSDYWRINHKHVPLAFGGHTYHAPKHSEGLRKKRLRSAIFSPKKDPPKKKKKNPGLQDSVLCKETSRLFQAMQYCQRKLENHLNNRRRGRYSFTNQTDLCNRSQPFSHLQRKKHSCPSQGQGCRLPFEDSTS